MTIDNLYERDFTAWAEAQVEALRKRSANEIDWENVAEEIESVGRSDTRAFNSLVEHILAHMLKIEFSGAERLRKSYQTFRGSPEPTSEHLLAKEFFGCETYALSHPAA